MKRVRIVLTILMLFAIGGCGILKNYQDYKAGDEFETSSKDYNRMIRWNEAESAGHLYADKSIREQYLARVADAKEVKVTDYRIKHMECDIQRGEGTVKVEIDYYIPPSITLKTLVDQQKWSYVNEGETKTWRLMTLLPEFK